MDRKILSFSQKEEMLEASCAWEDWVNNLTRPIKSLRFEVNKGLKHWQSRSAAMATGLTDHVLTFVELMMRVVVPNFDNA
jgi:hypothetical protein